MSCQAVKASSAQALQLQMTHGAAKLLDSEGFAGHRTVAPQIDTDTSCDGYETALTELADENGLIQYDQ